MRFIWKLAIPAYLSILPILGADALNIEGVDKPQTPRTRAFHSFLNDVAEEKFGLNLTSDQAKQRTVLKAADPTNENRLIGLFPFGTKSSQIITFIEEIVSGSSSYPISELDAPAEAASPKISRIVSDKEGNRFLIIKFSLPTPVAETLPPAVKSGDTSDHYEILLQRLEGFLAKAKEDATIQGKRLEGFAKNEVRPTIEQEARNTGKALENVGKKVGSIFGRKK